MARVLFVCLGNICRSPTAHGVFESLLAQRGFTQQVEVDSCGTAGWHEGKPPDRRATAEAATRGYDLAPLRARQVQPSDFEHYDYILAMDSQNLADLQQLCPQHYPGHLGLFLAYAEGAGVEEVPDPYYGDDNGFAQVLDLVEAASAGLLQELNRKWTISDEPAL